MTSGERHQRADHDPAGHEPTGLLEDPLDDGYERVGQRRANYDRIDEVVRERVLRLKRQGHGSSPICGGKSRGQSDPGE